MMEWSNTKFEDKLVVWKGFREKLADKNEEEKLQSVAKFFSKVPYGKRSIDYYTPESWPTPWELIDRDMHCLNTISLMMKNTLAFVGIDCTLILIDDGQESYILPLIEGGKMLNYDHGQVCNLSDHPEIKVIQKIS
jgi:hypothetical protein